MPKKQMQLDEELIIKLYNEGLSTGKIAKRMGVNDETVRQRLIKNNIDRRTDKQKYRLDKQKEMVDKFVAGASVLDIYEEYSISHASLITYCKNIIGEGEYEKILAQRGKRKPQCRWVYDNLFDNVSKDQTAWLLGLIYTDGNLSSQFGTLGICYQKGDEELTEKIKSTVNGGYIDNDSNRNCFTFRWHSRPMYQYCLDLGLTQNKSLTVKPPKIENLNWAGFLRGVVDGDGSVIIYKNTAWQITTCIVSGSIDFLIELQIIIKNLGFDSIVRLNTERNSHKLILRTMRDAVRFLNFIYQNSENNCLSRKKNKYLEFLELRPEFKNEEYLNKQPKLRFENKDLYCHSNEHGFPIREDQKPIFSEEIKNKLGL